MEQVPTFRIAPADKSYDSDAIRQPIDVPGIAPNIPLITNPRWEGRFSPVLYPGRNAIEHMVVH